ncbi:hypothetical protein GWO43_25795 [candidate division KSB1 bacterium]|nr:hypothetical protein [candidate division KSB1 bacterium]NIR69226.1 hypothetical protein [candidate division KSB1 bacterium]NIS27400.1 hypothetical protein [candidate division KSB1 bacterium]NIT74225.1 hypothetical protein [candidate division KSB1 bacterium]NIU28117.1 hypothetical protein [candidate division KSB1 bacterium]
MAKSSIKHLVEELNVTQLSCATLKNRIREMLDNSSQCKAILEGINPDTDEYRIVLHGILETNGAMDSN